MMNCHQLPCFGDCLFRHLRYQQSVPRFGPISHRAWCTDFAARFPLPVSQVAVQAELGWCEVIDQQTVCLSRCGSYRLIDSRALVKSWRPSLMDCVKEVSLL